MKSRPVYRCLELVPEARLHALVCDSRGAMAVRRVLDGTVWGGLTLRVWHLRAGQGEEAYAGLLDGFAGLDRECLPDTASLAGSLARALPGLPAGTRFYLAGAEAFLWEVHAVLRHGHVPASQIAMELCGSAARRVTCIHCKTLFTGVTTNPVRCPGCGLWLHVRDHFSRALGAYMGVRCDAEEPGRAPEPEEVFA